MKFLVDSDQVASYLNRREEAVALLDRIAGDGLAISVISYAELYGRLLVASRSSEVTFVDAD